MGDIVVGLFHAWGVFMPYRGSKVEGKVETFEFCPRCGARIREDDLTCPRCGFCVGCE